MHKIKCYKVRYEIVDGEPKLLTILVNDGWEIINTFPNPYPEPIFFALVELKILTHKIYDIENVKDHVYRGAKLDQWKSEGTTDKLLNPE